ncbi:MAG: PrsW family glutamic-type intramembrane protease [Patescibacteria group bacterium]
MDDQLNTILYSVFGGFLPIIVWLWFWLKEDREKPEPAGLIFRVFLAGGLAVAAAFLLERAACNLNWLTYACQQIADPEQLNLVAPSKILLLTWSAIEELLKLAAAYFVIFRRPEFDEPVDAMIYLITAALGFAALENSLFLFHTLIESGDNATFFLTGNLRFLGANIVHVVASAMVGGTIALAFCFHGWRCWFYTALGLITAILLHALFNFLIIMSVGNDLLKIFALLWLFTILIILLFEKVKTIVCQPVKHV